MRRDYARYRAKKSSSHKNGRQKLLLILCSIFILLAGGAFWIYQHKANIDLSAKEFTSITTQIKNLFNHKKSASAARSKQTTEPEDTVHFDFYTELPNMQVGTNSVAEKKETPKVSANTIQYIVQMGIFKDANTAGQSRLSLLLGGFESEVVKVSEEVYRLQQGPFASAAEAKAAQKKLEKKGIACTVEKLGL